MFVATFKFQVIVVKLGNNASFIEYGCIDRFQFAGTTELMFVKTGNENIEVPVQKACNCIGQLVARAGNVTHVNPRQLLTLKLNVLLFPLVCNNGALHVVNNGPADWTLNHQTFSSAGKSIVDHL